MERRRFLATLAAASGWWIGGRALGGAGRRAFHNDRVLVIGAGISGLAAAAVLRERLGFAAPGQVLVLEGRQRIGGRIFTDRSLGVPVDLGATWIHGADGNPITALAARYGLATQASDFNSYDAHDRGGVRIPAAVLQRAGDKFWNSMVLAKLYAARQPQDLSMAESLDAVGAAGMFQAGQERSAGDLMYYGEVDDRSLYLQELGAKPYGSEKVHGGGNLLFPNGYDGIVQGLAQGSDLRLGVTVRSIDIQGAQVVVDTDQGSFQAERCVVTLPLGVLKAGTVRFTPALPSGIQRSIAALAFGHRYKLVLEFPRVFWNPQVEFLMKEGRSQARYGAGEHFVFVDHGGITGRPILIAVAVGRLAESLEARSPFQAADRVMRDLRAMYGAGVPQPTAVRSTWWGAIPFTRGSYSGWRVGSHRADNLRFTQPVQDRLFFAGEHTHPDSYATVHGAFLSGLRAARQLDCVAS